MLSERRPAAPEHGLTGVGLYSLIAKWKKQGYEKLCCVRCIQSRVSLHALPLH
jgi:G10 protein